MSIRDTYKEIELKKSREKQQAETNAEHEYLATRNQKIQEISEAVCAHIETLFTKKSRKYSEYTLHRWAILKTRVIKNHLFTQLYIRVKSADSLSYKIGKESGWDDYNPSAVYIYYRNEADIQLILNRVVSFLIKNDVQLCYDTRFPNSSLATSNNYTSFAPVTAEALRDKCVALYLEL